MTDSKENAGEFPRFTVTSPARTKAGRLRDLFDEIEAAQEAGWRLDAIIRGLAEQQLIVTIDTLKGSIKRIRGQRKKAAEGQKSAPKKEPVQSAPAAADKPVSGTSAKGGGKISNEGYREPVQTFTRDVTKRTNLDE